MDKKQIAHILDHIAVLLELKDENPFKVRAYSNAARIIEILDEDIETLIAEDKLGSIKGIGSTLTEKITELATTGKMPFYEELQTSVPEGLLEMLRISGLGAKKIKILHDKLGISTVGELEYACKENRLVELHGFGEKTQTKILEGIKNLKKYKKQFLYSEVYPIAKNIIKNLNEFSEVVRCNIAGSLRRKKETVKDIDIVASALSEKTENIMNFFVSLPYIQSVVVKGDTKTSVVLENGVNTDLRVVSDMEFPYALHHFTGSKNHNIAMRSRAKKLDITMNEYGLFKDEKLILCKNEEEIFTSLGLAYILPELREDMGEIESAEKNILPHLIETTDIKGLFHIHTIYSDGNASITNLVESAKQLGFTYIGISDHSQSAFYAGGLKLEEILKQHAEIDALNTNSKDFFIFKGIEADILPDGNLDYTDDILAAFDFVIASVHTHFTMTEKEMTQRIIKAMGNKYVTMLGHPTGRILLAREPYQININQIINFASEHGVAIEINANPQRLDLDWRLCKYAKEQGAKMFINPDSHSTDSLTDVFLGVGIARKGWLEKKDITNTLSIKEMKKFLKI